MKRKAIAISGRPGAGSSTTAKLLAKRLGISYFSPGKLFKEISQGTYKNQFYYEEFKKLCDTRELVVPEFNSGDDSNATFNLWNTDFGKSKEFHQVIDDLSVLLAKKGDIVIDGKLALYMIKDAELKVWINASMNSRIKRTIKRDKINYENAKEVLKFREEKEKSEWMRIYGINPSDQEKEADLIIDSSLLDAEAIVDKIIESHFK